MNRTRILGLGIAVAAGVGALLISKNLIKAPSLQIVERQISDVEVLVAKSDIFIGEAVGSGNMVWQAWPKGKTDDYITRTLQPDAIASMQGSVARLPISKGDPVRKTKLVILGEGGVMAAILPAGMRAISLPIDSESAVDHLVLPNDRVDIIAAFSVGGEGRSQQLTETVLRTIRVLAIGQEFEQKNGKKVSKGQQATLQLTPVQVEMLTLARSKGRIWLSLRSLADAQVDQNVAVKVAQEDGTIKLLKYGAPSLALGVK